MELGGRAQAEKVMEEPAVVEIDLRRLDLALADILEPGLELPDHEGLVELVEVASHCFVGESHRSAELRGVPDLPVGMGEHRPETAHRRGADTDPGLREIALDLVEDHEARKPLVGQLSSLEAELIAVGREINPAFSERRSRFAREIGARATLTRAWTAVVKLALRACGESGCSP